MLKRAYYTSKGTVRLSPDVQQFEQNTLYIQEEQAGLVQRSY